MERSPAFEKENVIGHINSSPVLPSVKERRRVTVKGVFTSPLSVLKDSRQDNTFGSSRRTNSPKIAQFLSTPLQLSSDCKTPVNSWEEIRKLDEEELWIERTQVVTKEEHILYCDIAKEIVNSIINKLPIKTMDNDTNFEFTDSDLSESPDNTVVTDEKEEDVPTEIKTIALDKDRVPSPGDPLEKSVLEDNDFIHSCTNLDTTVKEILNYEESVSATQNQEDLYTDDVELYSDAEKTICPDNDEDIFNLLELQTNEIPDPMCENGTSEIQLDDDFFKSVIAGEAFALELDYLETIGNSDDGEHMSDLARQSLYVKFDPLVQASKSEGLQQGPSNLASINPADLLFAGPCISGSDLLVMETPPKKPAQSRVSRRDAHSLNEEQAPNGFTSCTTPVDHLFDFSPTAFSPTKVTIKRETEDGLQCNGDITEEVSSLVQPLMFSKDDLEISVAEERDKLMSEWKEETAFHELEMKEQTTKMERLLVEKSKAEAEILEMKTVMLEYEQTMAKMIEDREKSKSQHDKSNMEISQERDQLHHDLNNTEKSFAHLHARFEKLKTAVEGYRKNEGILKKAVSDLQENLKKSQEKYQLLKKHAEEKIGEANVEITRVQTNNKVEVAALQAALKRERSKNSSLQQNLDQKIKENKELTAICDELISKVGPIS